MRRASGATLIVAAILWGAFCVWAFATTDERDYLYQAAASVVALLYGWSNLFPKSAAVLAIDRNDPLMLSAHDQARRELPRFLRGVKELDKEPYIKYSLDLGTGEVEHVWGFVHSADSKTFIVTPVSEPIADVDKNTGRQAISVRDIEDWSLIDTSGMLEGGYTIAATARIYRRDKGYIPYAIKVELKKLRDGHAVDLR